MAALDPSDDRQIAVQVAGMTALLVAKAHKIQDRVANARTDRLSDKDAAGVYRIMQIAKPADIAQTLNVPLADPIATGATAQALEYMRDLFGRRAGKGVAMAQRALQLAVNPEQVATLCIAFTDQILSTRT